MEDKDYIELGLNGKAPLKLILCGNVQVKEKEQKVGVVSVVFATEKKSLAEKKLQELREACPESYYMVYSCLLYTSDAADD